MFDDIIELEDVYKHKMEISKRELELSTPKLSDLEFISTLYGWFCEYHDAVSEKNNAVELRKQFIFIILYLYSPQKLMGGKIVIGLRDALVNAIGLSAKTCISNNSHNLISDYKMIKGFRASVDQAYTLIQEKLGDMGIRV